MQNDEDSNRNEWDKWISVATDPTINENQLRIFMLIVSKYICDGVCLKEALYFPGKQSAEHLDIAFDEYAAEISVLDKCGLITIQSDSIDYVVLN
jgi:hypothetical protein